jgi:hypothetical protein
MDELYAAIVYMMLAPFFVAIFAALKLTHALKIGVIAAIFPAIACYAWLLSLKP